MEFFEVLNNRRSIRQYENYEVSSDTLKLLIESAQKAPSWKNSQVSRYYAVNTSEKLEEVKEFLPEFNQNNTLNAGAYIISTVENGRSGFTREGDFASHLKDGFQYFDNGLQVENLCLSAQNLGLGTLIMGLYDEQKIREYFNIPESQIIVCVISVGKPAINPAMPTRKNIDEILTIIK